MNDFRQEIFVNKLINDEVLCIKQKKNLPNITYQSLLLVILKQVFPCLQLSIQEISNLLSKWPTCRLF